MARQKRNEKDWRDNGQQNLAELLEIELLGSRLPKAFDTKHPNKSRQ
jgi:hypothetical protein